jgi:DNA primase
MEKTAWDIRVEELAKLSAVYTEADKKARRSRKNIAAWEARQVAWDAYEAALDAHHKAMEAEARAVHRAEREALVAARNAKKALQFNLFGEAA